MTAAQAPGIAWERIAPYTIAVHLVLPWILWGLAAVNEGAPYVLFALLHIGFPVLLAFTFKRWRHEFGTLLLLVAMNHVATFASAAVLAAVT